ncbi:hypothetical protein JOD02_001137 [Caldicoprobacter guelmensis]|nr:hypothetical protein [Caldicoprobacter guelmensis]
MNVVFRKNNTRVGLMLKQLNKHGSKLHLIGNLKQHVIIITTEQS